jgi:phosphoglycerate dehydrogenase-like enzyme
VVVACPLAAETRGLLDARRLGLMKETGVLINVARGEVVDEDALFAALRDKTIHGATLDVWYNYPTITAREAAPSRHPFHELPNVYMTPHCSAWTEGLFERRWGFIAANLDRFARGEPLKNVVIGGRK